MRFKNGSNKVVIELRVVQFWSEIIVVISNRADRSCMISDQIALHSVQLPLSISRFNNLTNLYLTNDILVPGQNYSKCME